MICATPAWRGRLGSAVGAAPARRWGLPAAGQSAAMGAMATTVAAVVPAAVTTTVMAVRVTAAAPVAGTVTAMTTAVVTRRRGDGPARGVHVDPTGG